MENKLLTCYNFRFSIVAITNSFTSNHKQRWLTTDTRIQQQTIFQFHANSVFEDTKHVTTNPCDNHHPPPLLHAVIYVLQRLGLKIYLSFFHIESISSITVLFPFAFQTETVYVCRHMYLYIYSEIESTFRNTMFYIKNRTMANSQNVNSYGLNSTGIHSGTMQMRAKRVMVWPNSFTTWIRTQRWNIPSNLPSFMSDLFRFIAESDIQF
jgi:hypothetical protein